MQIPDDQLRHATGQYLRALTFEAAALVVEAGGSGIISLPESLASYRDGREEAISALQEAFEDERIAIIVIERGK